MKNEYAYTTMKSVQRYLLSALLAVPMLTACQTPGGQDIPIKIAGGKTISVKVTPRGAVPAENEKVRITVAAVLIQAPQAIGDTGSLIWSFGLQTKTPDEITRITVENVFPSDPAVQLHTDENPRLKDGDWIGQLNNGDPDGEQNGWLRAKGPTSFVFKFTVRYKDGTETSLHQLSMFNDNAKQFFQNHLDRFRIRTGS